MELRFSFTLTLLMLSIIEFSYQNSPGSDTPIQVLESMQLPVVTENPPSDEPQPGNPYPYGYPPWPIYQYAGMPFAPPQTLPFQGGPAYPQPYPWPYAILPQPVYHGVLSPIQQQPQELINLGSQSPLTPPCATILTTSNCILRVPDDGLHKDVLSRGFVFAAGLIKDQCSFTVQDCSGAYTTTSEYIYSSGGTCSTATTVCCECYGCARTSFPKYENSCAIMFENARCSMCHGFRLEVGKGDKIAMMNTVVEDKVSSIYVIPGCELRVYKDSEFLGDAAIAEGAIDYLPYEWNDAISSYQCFCPGDDNSNNTTQPSAVTPETSTLGVETTAPATSTQVTTGRAITTPKFEETTTSLPLPITTPKFEETTTSLPLPITTLKSTTDHVPPEMSTTPEDIITTQSIPTPTQQVFPPKETTQMPISTSTTMRSTTDPFVLY